MGGSSRVYPEARGCPTPLLLKAKASQLFVQTLGGLEKQLGVFCVLWGQLFPRCLGRGPSLCSPAWLIV